MALFISCLFIANGWAQEAPSLPDTLVKTFYGQEAIVLCTNVKGNEVITPPNLEVAEVEKLIACTTAELANLPSNQHYGFIFTGKNNTRVCLLWAQNIFSSNITYIENFSIFVNTSLCDTNLCDTNLCAIYTVINQ